MSKSQHFASRYIVDVSIEENYIQLGDSSRAKYYIDRCDKNVIAQFKTWFANVFSKGIPGTLTIFEYEKVSNDGQVDLVIKKFLKTDGLNESETKV